MRRILTTCSSFCLLLSFAGHSLATISLDDLRQQIPQMNWQALEKGEVIWQPLPRAELDDSALVTITAVKLSVDKESAVKQLQRYNNEIFTLAIDTRSAENTRKSLEKFQIAARPEINLDWFNQPKDDGNYNVSAEELDTLQKAAAQLDNKNTRQARQQTERIVQQLLAKRVKEYQQKGLAGISSYRIHGKDIHPGDYLANSLAALSLLEDKEPAFFKPLVITQKNRQPL